MANIMDYLEWRGDLSFGSAPFNDVDNLILTQIVYLDFRGIVPTREEGTGILLKDAARKYAAIHPNLDDGSIPPLFRNAARLLLAMADTERYRHCLLTAFEHDISKEIALQFAALRILLDDGSTFVSFSGTDDSITGWKENFNMSFVAETAGQMRSLEYLTQTVSDCVGDIRVGGHSKGGNLAVFAAMHLPDELQKRITAVYNNDGPGFTDEMISKAGYKAICDRIHTFMPQSSVVGILLEHQEKYQVIRSTSLAGAWQHAAITWEVLGTSFVKSESFTNESRLVDKTITTWLTTTTPEKRKQFVEALFSILDSANIDDTEDLMNINLKKLIDVVRIADKLDAEDKIVLKDTIKLMVEAMISSEETIAVTHKKSAYLRKFLNLFQRRTGETPDESEVISEESEPIRIQKRND